MVSLIRPTAPRAGKAHYQRHQPERTQLYQLVEQHYPTFSFLMANDQRGQSNLKINLLCPPLIQVAMHHAAGDGARPHTTRQHTHARAGNGPDIGCQTPGVIVDSAQGKNIKTATRQ